MPRDYAEAAKWYRKAAEQGDVDAQYNLGDMYRYGLGVSQDYTEGVKWYRKAAEQGHVIAQYNLGNLYRYGQIVPRDYAEAAKWYRKAAEQADVDAQFNLADMYYNGQGVPQDYVEAYKWYNLAASQGDKAASISRNNLASQMTPDQIARGSGAPVHLSLAKARRVRGRACDLFGRSEIQRVRFLHIARRLLAHKLPRR